MHTENEYNLPSNNNMVVNNIIGIEQIMNEKKEKGKETQKGTEVILQFPEKTEDAESIIKEVKFIMKNTLYEYLKKIS